MSLPTYSSSSLFLSFGSTFLLAVGCGISVVISSALLVAVDLPTSSSIGDDGSHACFEPTGSADVAATDLLLLLQLLSLSLTRRFVLSLSRPPISACIFSSIRCRHSSLWPFSWDPVADAEQPGHPSVHLCVLKVFFLANVHTSALDVWGSQPQHIQQVSLWHFRPCKHTDWNLIRSWFIWLLS